MGSTEPQLSSGDGNSEPCRELRKGPRPPAGQQLCRRGLLNQEEASNFTVMQQPPDRWPQYATFEICFVPSDRHLLFAGHAAKGLVHSHFCGTNRRAQVFRRERCSRNTVPGHGNVLVAVSSARRCAPRSRAQPNNFSSPTGRPHEYRRSQREYQ
jgi:hypothetical protein